MVAAAIIGGAVIGAAGTAYAGSQASGAIEAGSASAAQATLQATMMQIMEIQRQFNYQQQILFPQIQNQYAGQSAIMDLLGLSGGAGDTRTGAGGVYGGAPEGSGRDFQAEMADIDQQIQDVRNNVSGGGGGYTGVRSAIEAQQTIRELEEQRAGVHTEYQTFLQSGGTDLQVPGFPGSGTSQFARGDRGQIIDPNIDQTRLADINTLPDQVRNTLLAGTSLEDDPYAAAVGGRRLAEGAAGTGVYGDVFTESPGYAFQVEEMNRGLERGRSAGGNYGGRAIMEAQRRGQGLAAGEYYNWAAGRERDLGRLGGAEQFDMSRDDEAMYNYLTRRAGDASRLDAAAGQEDALQGVDQQRGDQAYYNLLSQIFGVAGFGDPGSQAVSSSQAAGGAVASAYGQQGSQLSANAQNLGVNQANIGASTTASLNNIFQQMMQSLIASGQFGEQ